MIKKNGMDGTNQGMKVIVHKMMYNKEYIKAKDLLPCIPFDERYFQDYMEIYNECFYEMRRALEIKPYNFLNRYDQIADKVKDIYLLIDNEEIIGSVACYGNEIDDLIVNKKYRCKGYGRRLLLWAIQHIREKNTEPITLHVAEWNQNAIALYKKSGFEISNTERIR